MKRTNLLQSVIVAGVTSACLVAGGATAPPKPSAVEDTTEKNVKSVNETTSDKTAEKAQEKASSKSNAEGKAKKDAKAKAEAKKSANAKAGVTNQGAQKQADSKTKSNAKAKTKKNAKAEARTKNQNAQAKADSKAKANAKADRQGNAKANAKAKTTAKANAENQKQGSGNTNARLNEQLGIRFDEQDSQSLQINSVQNGSFAANAGLKKGDEIVSIDGRSFSSRGKMNAYLSNLDANRARVIFNRNGQRYRTFLTWNDRQMRRRARRPQFNTYFSSGNRGIVIDKLPKSGPIRSSGLQPGDEIVCFNGFAYRNVDRFVASMNRLPKGRPIPVNVMRDGRIVSTRMTLAPQSRTYADDSNQTRQMAEGSRQGNTPPPPSPRDFNNRNLASQNADGRRTALRPNLEEMSTQQLRQRVQTLRQENQKLKKRLNKLQENSSSDRPSNLEDSEKSQNQSSSSNNKNASKN